ncbi:MAG: hypothetical protein WEB30_19795 [Cyclobacteriaceae bacterium]
MGWLDLVEETIEHFREGARSVRAHTDDTTYIITKDKGSGEFIIAVEEPDFPKIKTKSLEEYFKNVYGIEALY